MNLLERIAHSNRDPQRTIVALRLINGSLERELSQRQKRLSATINLNRSPLWGPLRFAINSAVPHRQERQ